MFQVHENDLNDMFTLSENLKNTIEKVRTKNNDNLNDMNKLTAIINQLNERWLNALKIYKER